MAMSRKTVLEVPGLPEAFWVPPRGGCTPIAGSPFRGARRGCTQAHAASKFVCFSPQKQLTIGSARARAALRLALREQGRKSTDTPLLGGGDESRCFGASRRVQALEGRLSIQRSRVQVPSSPPKFRSVREGGVTLPPETSLDFPARAQRCGKAMTFLGALATC